MHRMTDPAPPQEDASEESPKPTTYQEEETLKRENHSPANSQAAQPQDTQEEIEESQVKAEIKKEVVLKQQNLPEQEAQETKKEELREDMVPVQDVTEEVVVSQSAPMHLPISPPQAQSPVSHQNQGMNQVQVFHQLANHHPQQNQVPVGGSGIKQATTPTVIRQLTSDGVIISEEPPLQSGEFHPVPMHGPPQQMEHQQQPTHHLQHQPQPQPQPQPHQQQEQAIHLQYVDMSGGQFSGNEGGYYIENGELILTHPNFIVQDQNEQISYQATSGQGFPGMQEVAYEQRYFPEGQPMDPSQYQANYPSIMLVPPEDQAPTQCVNCGRHDATMLDAMNHTICQVCYDGRLYRAPMPTRHPKKPSSAKAQKAVAQSRRAGVECANCKTSKTTLWRRNNQGEPVCNSCGLYFKLHGVNRPQAMKKDTIQTRKRKPKSTSSHPVTSSLNQHAARLNGMAGANMHHHHPYHSMPSTSGYEPAGNIHYVEQPPYLVPQPYEMLHAGQLPAAIQPVQVYRGPVNAVPASNGHQPGQEEQATVITSTSTVAGVYRNPDQDQEENDDPNNNMQ